MKKLRNGIIAISACSLIAGCIVTGTVSASVKGSNNYLSYEVGGELGFIYNEETDQSEITKKIKMEILNDPSGLRSNPDSNLKIEFQIK